jgi:VWFA-related protein
MQRVPILAAGWVLCVAALTGARQDQGQAPPVFRSGVEVIQLDVTVLDRNRQPVRGLTAADFRVRVDGEPRTVVAFKAVELPPPAPSPTARWLRDIAPDVVANARPTGRALVILIDDGSFNTETGAADLFAVRKTRETARAIVDQLGDGDLAAVLFTDNSHWSQNFTRDRARMIRAIDDAALLPSPSVDLGESPSCQCGACSIAAIGQIATMLRSLPAERKTIMYLSAGVPVVASVAAPYNPIGASEIYRRQHCNAVQRHAMDEAIRQAGLANVTVQAIDVRGLLPSGIDPRIGYLRAMSEDTGGRAVVRRNDMEREVPALLAESSSYYLLGVEAPLGADDGRLHEIDVTVDREDAEVRTRRGYHVPTAAERRRLAARGDRPVDTAMAGVLPKADVPLDVSVFALADPEVRERAAIGVVLGVMRNSNGANRPLEEKVQVVVTVFQPESGRSVASHAQTLRVRWNRTGDPARFEALSRLPIRPGRYEVRAAVEMGDGQTGSISTYADVPDFRRADLTMSDLVLAAEPPTFARSPTAFGDLIPLSPTADRVFARSQRATAWVRVYRRSAVAASLTMRITDEHDAVVLERTSQFDSRPGRSADSLDGQLALPIGSLPAGEYLLTAEAAAGNEAVSRHARFRVEK